jgi:hypothetical protein
MLLAPLLRLPHSSSRSWLRLWTVQTNPCFLGIQVAEKLRILFVLTRTHSYLWKVTTSSCLEGRQKTKSSGPEGRQTRTGLEFDTSVVVDQSCFVCRNLELMVQQPTNCCPTSCCSCH